MGRKRNKADPPFYYAAINAMAPARVAVQFETVSLDNFKEFRVSAYQAWHGMLKPVVLS